MGPVPGGDAYRPGMTAGYDLGAVVRRFPTDVGRRKRIFLVSVPVSAVVAALAGLVLVVVARAGGPTAPVLLPGLVCGLAIGVLLTGLGQGWLAITRTAEVFTLYERGLVHSYTGSTRAIGWPDIVKVTVERRGNALYRALGQDVRYRVKLRPGIGGRRVLVITALTDDVEQLGETIRQRAAVQRPAGTTS